MGLGQWLLRTMGWGERKLPDSIAGEIDRIGCAQAHAQSRGYYVLMLIGDSRKHRLSAETFEHAEALALAKPGDFIEFVAEPTGHGAEEALTLISFHNSTLSTSLLDMPKEEAEAGRSTSESISRGVDVDEPEDEAEESLLNVDAARAQKGGVLHANLIKYPHGK